MHIPERENYNVPMDARQKLLIASIVLFAASVPWKLVGGLTAAPFALLFLFDGLGTSTGNHFLFSIACTFLGALALFASWAAGFVNKATPALLFGCGAVFLSIVLIFSAAAAPDAVRTTNVELIGYLVWLGSAAAALLAGIACLSRVANTK